MNFLFTTQPALGSFHPMIPLGQALKKRGHKVAVASSSSLEDSVKKAGFDFYRAGLEFSASYLPETLPEVLNVPYRERTRWILDEIFLDRAPRKLIPDLLKIAPDFDVIVNNNYEIGGMLAAEILDMPYATCNISTYQNRQTMTMMYGEKIGKLRKEFGLPQDPMGSAYGRYLDLRFMMREWSYLNGFTHSSHILFLLKKLFSPQGGQALKLLYYSVSLRLMNLLKQGPNHVRQEPEYFLQLPGLVTEENEAKEILEKVRKLPYKKTVLITLGTVYATLHPEIFSFLIEALGQEQINLIVTLGKSGDPGKFGDQPSHILIERYIPQDLILPYVDLCINHSGNGTVRGTIDAGVPMILLPMAADQPVIAAICHAHGIAVPLPARARMLDAYDLVLINPGRLNKKMIQRAVRKGLDNSKYREAVLSLQKEFSKLKDVDYGAQLLEKLAVDKKPVINTGMNEGETKNG